MAAVELQYLLKKALSLCCATQSSQSLCAEKQAIDSIALAKVFVEQQHRRQRSGKVVDSGLRVFEFDRVIINAREQIRSLDLPAQALKCKARPECHVRHIPHRHLLEITFLLCRTVPPCTRIFDITASAERLANPVANVALICQQVLCLTEALWRLKSGGELIARFHGISDIEGSTPEQ